MTSISMADDTIEAELRDGVIGMHLGRVFGVPEPGTAVEVSQDGLEWETRTFVVAHKGLFYCETDVCDNFVLQAWDRLRPVINHSAYDLSTFPTGPALVKIKPRFEGVSQEPYRVVERCNRGVFLCPRDELWGENVFGVSWGELLDDYLIFLGDSLTDATSTFWGPAGVPND